MSNSIEQHLARPFRALFTLQAMVVVAIERPLLTSSFIFVLCAGGRSRC